VFQNLAFPAARKSPRIKDRKRPNIKSIWGRLRSLIPGVLARSKCQLLNHDRYKINFSLLLVGGDLNEYKVEYDSLQTFIFIHLEDDEVATVEFLLHLFVLSCVGC